MSDAINARVHELKAEMVKHLQAARNIATKADSAKRDFTSSERSTVADAMAKAYAIKDEIKALTGDADLYKALEDFGSSVSIGSGTKAGSWGAKVVQEGGWKAIAASGEVLVPTTLNTDVIRDARQARFITDLIPTETLEGTTLYAYLRQSLRDNQAAVVAKGETKPTSAYEVSRETGEIHVVAHLSEPQDKYALQDSKYLGAFLESEMRYGLEVAIEDAILNGDGRDPALIAGILADTALQSQAFATDLFTTARKALTKLQKKGVQPDAFIISADDAESFDLVTDNEGRYYFRGPDQANGDNSPIWSVPIVTSTAVATGSGLMGHFREGARIFTDGRVAIEYSDAEGFDTNEVKVRAETRVNVGVTRPWAFCTVDLTA